MRKSQEVTREDSVRTAMSLGLMTSNEGRRVILDEWDIKEWDTLQKKHESALNSFEAEALMKEMIEIGETYQNLSGMIPAPIFVSHKCSLKFTHRHPQYPNVLGFVCTQCWHFYTCALWGK